MHTAYYYHCIITFLDTHNLVIGIISCLSRMKKHNGIMYIFIIIISVKQLSCTYCNSKHCKIVVVSIRNLAVKLTSLTLFLISLEYTDVSTSSRCYAHNSIFRKQHFLESMDVIHRINDNLIMLIQLNIKQLRHNFYIRSNN